MNVYAVWTSMRLYVNVLHATAIVDVNYFYNISKYIIIVLIVLFIELIRTNYFIMILHQQLAVVINTLQGVLYVLQLVFNSFYGVLSTFYTGC